MIVWDVGADQGLAVELNGHSDRLVGIAYDSPRKLLITCSADGHVGVWPMNVKRNETPKWTESSKCQICQLPFFWNVRAMWNQKQLGSRQVLKFDRLTRMYRLHSSSIIVENVAELYVINVLIHAKHYH